MDEFEYDTTISTLFFQLSDDILHTVDLSHLYDNTDDQQLSFSNDTLYLEDGGQVYLGFQNGVDGATGATGPQGATGPAGQNGASGIDGATGPTGPAGLNGLDGAMGATGPQGVTGAPGQNGASGVDGVTGPTGPAGLNGLDGATGATGPQGVTGAPGQEPGADGIWMGDNRSYWPSRVKWIRWRLDRCHRSSESFHR